MAASGKRGLVGRRELLAATAGSAATLLFGSAATRGQTAPATVSAATHFLNEGLAILAGLGGNVIVRSSDAGVVLVDSGDARFAQSLAEQVDRIRGERPVVALFNTHWHLEQVGGNALFAAGDTRVIAHAKTLAHLRTPYYLPAEDRYQEPLPAGAQPTESFYEAGSLTLGAERIDYGYLLEAHTDGDIYVHFTDANVIAAGDALSPERDPVFDWYGGGWLGGRIDSLELLLARSDNATRFVPSYGEAVGRDYVEAELELMLGLYDILFERVRAGESAADILASGALDALPRRFGDPGKLLYDLHKGIWAHYNTISPDIV